MIQDTPMGHLGLDILLATYGNGQVVLGRQVALLKFCAAVPGTTIFWTTCARPVAATAAPRLATAISGFGWLCVARTPVSNVIFKPLGREVFHQSSASGHERQPDLNCGWY